MSEEPRDITAVVAVLSHQMGEIKQTLMTAVNDIKAELGSQRKRIGALEEQEIRRQERDKAEDRLREVLKEERQEHAESARDKITIRLTRVQVWIAVITGLAIVAGGVVAVLQAL